MVDRKKESIEDKILAEVKRLNLTPDEASHVLKQLHKPEKVRRSFDHFYGSSSIKIGVVSDLHCGSAFFNYEAFENSIKTFTKEKVEAIYIPGDIIEGMSNRDGHIYELEKIGTTNQINHACELLKQYKQPIFFTTGNHDEWAKNKANQGVLVGPTVENKVKGATFLGEYTARVNLSPTVEMRLTHEGASAYALSYSLQKRINALSGGDKPAIILNGHLHKAIALFYRNIYAYECATMQNQTPFMQMKGSPAMVGYYVLNIQHNKKGVNEIDTKFYPYY